MICEKYDILRVQLLHSGRQGTDLNIVIGRMLQAPQQQTERHKRFLPSRLGDQSDI